MRTRSLGDGTTRRDGYEVERAYPFPRRLHGYYSESLVLVIGVHCLAEVMVTVHMPVARTSQIDSRHGDAMTITPPALCAISCFSFISFDIDFD